MLPEPHPFPTTHHTSLPAGRLSAGGPLLGVWAHPDDEAFMSAGLMAAARRDGRRVVILTMTAGELGTADPARWPAARLGALRRHELRAGLAALDVTEHHVVGLPDGGCERFDATPLIERAMRDVRPATIVTFGPDGFTGHPDHKAVHRWTTRAWRATGHRGTLLYATVTPSFHSDFAHLNDAVRLWSVGDGRRAATPEAALSHRIRLSGHDLDQKVAALRAHASQTSGMIAAVGEDAFRRWWAEESFVAAHPRDRGRAVSRRGPGRSPAAPRAMAAAASSPGPAVRDPRRERTG